MLRRRAYGVKGLLQVMFFDIKWRQYLYTSNISTVIRIALDVRPEGVKRVFSNIFFYIHTKSLSPSSGKGPKREEIETRFTVISVQLLMKLGRS